MWTKKGECTLCHLAVWKRQHTYMFAVRWTKKGMYGCLDLPCPPGILGKALQQVIGVTEVGSTEWYPIIMCFCGYKIMVWWLCLFKNKEFHGKNNFISVIEMKDIRRLLLALFLKCNFGVIRDWYKVFLDRLIPLVPMYCKGSSVMVVEDIWLLLHFWTRLTCKG